MPNLIQTVINIIVPEILAALTEYEHWDFAATQTKHEIWRIYLATISNNILFIIIYIAPFIELTYIPIAAFADIANFAATNSPTLTYECKEDYVEAQFLQQVKLFVKS